MRGIKCPVDRQHTCLTPLAIISSTWIHTFLLSTSTFNHVSPTIQQNILSPYCMAGLPLGPSIHLTLPLLYLSCKDHYVHLPAGETEASGEMTPLNSHCSAVQTTTSFCLPLSLHPLCLCIFSGFLSLTETSVKEPNHLLLSSWEIFKFCVIQKTRV